MPPKRTKSTSNAIQNAATPKGVQTNLHTVTKVTGLKFTSSQASQLKPKPKGQPRNTHEASNNNVMSLIYQYC